MRFLYRHHLVLRLVIEKFSICKIKHNLFNAHVYNILEESLIQDQLCRAT